MEFTDNEKDSILAAFEEMNIKPKCDDPNTFKQWLNDFVVQQQQKDVKPDLKDLQTAGTTNVTLPPKVSTFSGEDKDTAFDLWLYEVNCLRKSGMYREGLVTIQVRKSLKGHPARVAMRMGDQATLDELLETLTSLYGNVQTSEHLLAAFYNASQGETETVVEWSHRLEDLLTKATENQKKDPRETEQMLRSKFWASLRPSLRDKSRHKFDTVPTFDKLRIELRQIEMESGGVAKKTTNKVQQPKTDDQPDPIKILTQQVVNLTQQVQNLAAGGIPAVPPQQHSQQQQQRPQQQYHNQQQQQNSNRGQNRSSGARPKQNNGPQQFHNTYNQYNNTRSTPAYDSQEPECWRCGQLGHLAVGCRVRTDHLNPRRPTSTGGQQ